MDASPAPPRTGPPIGMKLLVLGLVALAVGIGFAQFREILTLQYLAEQESALRRVQGEHPLAVFAAAFLIYVVVTGLSLPGATVLTLVCGWYFGFWRGLVLVSCASTTGATVAFLVSRFLLRDTLERRFGDRLVTFNQALAREGAFYLFMLRLIPAVPFFVINVVMGLTPLRLRTYWWVSQLGMLPGTAVYVYAGASVPDLSTLSRQGLSGILTPQLFVAFVLLGLVPLALKKLVERWRPRPASDPSVPSEAE